MATEQLSDNTPAPALVVSRRVYRFMERLVALLYSETFIDRQLATACATWPSEPPVGSFVLTQLIHNKFQVQLFYQHEEQCGFVSLLPHDDPQQCRLCISLEELERHGMSKMHHFVQQFGETAFLRVHDRSSWRCYREFVLAAMFAERFRERCRDVWRNAASSTHLLTIAADALSQPHNLRLVCSQWLRHSRVRTFPALLQTLLAVPMELTLLSNGDVQLFPSCSETNVNTSVLEPHAAQALDMLRAMANRSFHSVTVRNAYNNTVCSSGLRMQLTWNVIMNHWRIKALRVLTWLLLLLAYRHDGRSAMIMYLYRTVWGIYSHLLCSPERLHHVLQRSQVECRDHMLRSLEFFSAFLLLNASVADGPLDHEVRRTLCEFDDTNRQQ
jgi:hypothetical protein